MGLPLDNYELLKQVGIFGIEYPYPEYNELKEKLVPKEPLDWNEEKQVYIRYFDIVPLTEEEAEGALESAKQRKFDTLRESRDFLLTQTDYMLIPDYPINSQDLAVLKEYRQALRDLPSQEGAPWLDTEVPWPTKPEFLGD